jgi:hypothetical protein
LIPAATEDEVMKPTTIMSRDDWISGTKAFFTRGRSTGEGGLEAVDNALLMFELCTNNQWPECLRVVEENLDAWIRKKTNDAGKLKTSRDKDVIQTLKDQLRAALAGRPPEVWSGDYPPIFVSNDIHKGNVEVPTAWKGRVEVILGELYENARGRELLKLLSDACEERHQRVVVAFGSNQCAPCTLEVIQDDDKRLKPDPKAWMANPNIVQIGIEGSGAKRKFMGGNGSSALVLFDPDVAAGPDGDRPSWIALGHELVHAYHYVTGTCARPLAGSTDADSGLSEEEMQTIGTRGYQRQKPSENWLRDGAGLPDRTRYSGYDFSATRCTLTGG